VINQQARPLESFALPKALRLLVLAPHPDDFDAIGVTLRFFMKGLLWKPSMKLKK
jgi:hypothetical protein